MKGTEPGTFVDTNVLFYALDGRFPRKQKIAADIVVRLWSSRSGILSVQIISELATSLRKKLDLDWRKIARIVEPYTYWRMESIEPVDTLEAIRIASRHRIGYWDGLVVRAACKARADVLLTEDLSHQQTIEGVRIENPFA
jgi:predicted nucleic acid-binding protein